MYGTDLTLACVKYSDFNDVADLYLATIPDSVLCYNSGLAQVPPDSGSYVAWKSAILAGSDGDKCIVKLKIPSEAMRSSAATRKCRASKARVLGIYDLNGNKLDKAHAVASHDPSFKYSVGKVVEPDTFDTNRWNECAPGIHHFLSFVEAVNYAN